MIKAMSQQRRLDTDSRFPMQKPSMSAFIRVSQQGLLWKPLFIQTK